MPLTAAELEEIRLADEAIEREWVEDATERAINKEVDRWVDEMAIVDLLDKRQRASRAHQREYYEAHKDEIAAHQREYREAHKDEIAAYMREYMREYRKGRRRREAKT